MRSDALPFQMLGQDPSGFPGNEDGQDNGGSQPNQQQDLTGHASLKVAAGEPDDIFGHRSYISVDNNRRQHSDQRSQAVIPEPHRRQTQHVIQYVCVLKRD